MVRGLSDSVVEADVSVHVQVMSLVDSLMYTLITEQIITKLAEFELVPREIRLMRNKETGN